MRKHPGALFFHFLVCVLQIFATERGRASEESGLQCRHCSAQGLPGPGAVDSPSYRKYTPDRSVDLLHLALDITPDFDRRTIKGVATLKFRPIAKPLEELRLNAVDLSVLESTSSETGLKWHVTDAEIVLHFTPAVPVGKEATVSVRYSAEPKLGLYFRTKQMGYSTTGLWTQGESIESRHWFPCVDHPVAKYTTEVTCHVPKGMVVLSNGHQVSLKTDAEGLDEVRWLQDKPHANYLVTLVAGELAKVEEMHRGIPLQFWTVPGELPQAANSFRRTKNVMEFLERETGVPYPWDKYAQVTIEDYHWGGKENTSLTTLTDRTLFHTETENLFVSDSLVAHELAHQWFGDFVTCKDWSHTWLNEGFATYYDWLWQGSFAGEEETQVSLYGAAKGIFNNASENRGIVWRKFNEPYEMFNYLAYPKGAWVLHMLRCQLGPDLYRECIRTYLQRHAYGSVTSDDLRLVVEELSGRSFERFFDQWLNGVGAPVVDVAYEWDSKARLARVSVKQTQKITEEAPLFQFPLSIRFETKEGRSDHMVLVREKEEDFYFSLQSAPELLRVNHDQSLLAKINFKAPKPMVFKQLADNRDVVGQLLALEQLAEKPNQEAVKNIKAVLQGGKHYSVRMKAAEVLQQARSDEGLAALVESVKQPDARVRNAVVKALGGYFHPTARGALEQVLRSEKNPGIQATALRGLGVYQSDAVRERLESYLGKSCYKERLADAAIAALRSQDDARAVPALMEWIVSRGAGLPSSVLTAGLDAVGFLQRNEPDKTRVREMLLSYVNHPRERTRLGAIAGLGSLEDPRAVGVLETLAQASAYRTEKEAAVKALEKIRAVRKPGEELKDLRTELLRLQDAGRELKKEVETLRKKHEVKP